MSTMKAMDETAAANAHKKSVIPEETRVPMDGWHSKAREKMSASSDSTHAVLPVRVRHGTSFFLKTITHQWDVTQVRP